MFQVTDTSPAPKALERGALLLSARGIDKTYMSPSKPLARFWTALLNRSLPSDSHHVLRSIDLDVYSGENLGILGRNGAGKSTILGILAGVIPATRGSVHRYSRIAVLLELGAGFDQNLTGRENARVFCSLMGMSYGEAEGKIPLIERFVDIGDYFDMPARTYSSGMYARVAFASAIHVNADLIIVDETLSVGDASFRVKCYNAIERMQNEGKTFLMVSHNQNVIANFCSRAIVIEGGRKVFDGEPLEAVNTYKRIRHEAEARAAAKRDQEQKQRADITALAEQDDGVLSHDVKLEAIEAKVPDSGADDRRITVTCSIVALRDTAPPTLNLLIRNAHGVLIGAMETDPRAIEGDMVRANTRVELSVSFENRLAPGAYFLSLAVWCQFEKGREPLSFFDNCHRLDIVKPYRVDGVVDLGFNWRVAQRQTT